MEVKTVVKFFSDDTDDDYEASDNVHPWKLKRLGRVIQTYILENKIDEDKIEWQQLLSIYLNKQGD